ncbi:hypothetical protein C0J52_11191 [Blattella germanica]|nr:hypothetical protein C0J52_11191 [Blattella germanica]
MMQQLLEMRASTTQPITKFLKISVSPAKTRFLDTMPIQTLNARCGTGVCQPVGNSASCAPMAPSSTSCTVFVTGTTMWTVQRLPKSMTSTTISTRIRMAIPSRKSRINVFTSYLLHNDTVLS